MATVRKRVLPSGKVVWLAAYKDGAGGRRFKQFSTRREADAFLTRAKAEVAVGSHVPDRQASTVEYAYNLLITELESDGAARSTMENYKSYYKGHVKPFLANRLLPKLQAADVADWLEELKIAGRTADTRRRARIVLGAVFDEAIRRRLAFSNPVRALRSRRKPRRANIREAEEKVKIPERSEVRKMLGAAGDEAAMWLCARRKREGGAGYDTVAIKKVSATKPQRTFREFELESPECECFVFRPASWLRPLLSTLALAGLRIGEARGLGWLRLLPDTIQVRDGVDPFWVLGPVKTAAALRDVPIGPHLASILLDWKRASKAPHDLLFTTRQGTPLRLSNLIRRQLAPLQIVLGITDPDGLPRWTAHSFRHFAVSLWIDEGANLKQVSEWAGHENPEFTQRVYGHLFKRSRTDRSFVAAGELSVLGATQAQHANDNPTESIEASEA
jgi:integrase